jgi:hypothetical protein
METDNLYLLCCAKTQGRPKEEAYIQSGHEGFLEEVTLSYGLVNDESLLREESVS